MVTRLHESWQRARDHMARAQDRYATQANKHRRDVDFGVGDKVWITTKHWQTDRPSRKLANQMEGPYEIVEQIGHSFKLKLPSSMKIHPVFHAEKLRKDPGNPLLGQANLEPLPLELEDCQGRGGGGSAAAIGNGRTGVRWVRTGSGHGPGAADYVRT